MRPIPPKLREALDLLPRMHVCERRNSDCQGRITWEHAWTYAGSQINELWAIIGLCEWHHLGAGIDKGLNRFISLGYASKKDLKKYPSVNWDQQWDWLSKKYAGKARIPGEGLREAWEIPLETLDGERAENYRHEIAAHHEGR